MTNLIAICLLLIIAALFAIDLVWLDLGLPVLAGKMFDDFIEYVSFWR